MRRVNCRRAVCAPILFGLTTTLAAALTVAPATWGYVNGGDYRNTLTSYQKKLKDGGWAANFGAPMSGMSPRGVGGQAFVPPDKPGHERYVNQLVGRALQSLPEKSAGKISDAMKEEVARLTREAIRQAAADKRQVLKTGRTGSLQYEVGAFAYEAYWETNYGGKRKVHELRSGLVPFVALKVVDTKAPEPGTRDGR